MLQQLVWRTVEAEVASPAHHDDAVVEVHAAGCVGDECHGLAGVCQAAEELGHVVLEPWVQSGGRLIEEKRSGPVQQLNTNGHPLALAA